ncbi:hypothetical protein NECAME_17666, partial [Necator americanus]
MSPSHQKFQLKVLQKELYLLSKAMMTMERTIATIYVDSYERWRCSTGNLGVVMSILSAILVELYIYIGVSFKEPHISATSTPDEVTGRINEVLIFNVSCSTITMTIMIALLFTNKKRKTKSIGCVSRRFQIDENIVTTEFIAKIAFVQLVAFSIQSLGGLILRSSLENFFTENDLPALKSIKLSLQEAIFFTKQQFHLALAHNFIAKEKRWKIILSAILVELYIYIGVSFKEPHISATSTPDEVTGRINEVLIFNVSCCTITMTIMIVLLLTNKKRKTKSIGCVSRRFQIDENIVTTEFIAKIAFVQLVAFSIQSLGGLILRSSLENFFTENDLPALKSIKLSLQ